MPIVSTVLGVHGGDFYRPGHHMCSARPAVCGLALDVATVAISKEDACVSCLASFWMMVVV